MPDESAAHIGLRIRDIRKRRGMSQKELAEAAHVSVSLIRKLEQGEKQDTRLETARQIADGLGVPTTRLLGRHHEEGADEGTLDRWGPLRRALAAPPGYEGAEEPTLEGVSACLDAALPLFSGDRFAELSTVLPALVRDAGTLAELDPRGRPVRGRLMQLTGWLLTSTRQFEDAADALDRADEGAVDALDGAATASTRCWLLLRRGRLEEARTLAITWADQVEPRMSRATPSELSAWGWLLLRASAAAVRDRRPDEARDTLRLANSAAVAAGHEYAPRGDFLRAFGQTTVLLKRAENAMISGRPDLVLKLAARQPTRGLRPTSNNRNRHLLDVANAHYQGRQNAEAFEVLQQVWADAPEWMPNQRYARDILTKIVTRRRTLTPDMRSMADALKIPM